MGEIVDLRDIIEKSNKGLEARMGGLPQPQTGPKVTHSVPCTCARPGATVCPVHGRVRPLPAQPPDTAVLDPQDLIDNPRDLGPTGPLGPQPGDPEIPPPLEEKLAGIRVATYLAMAKLHRNVSLDEIEIESRAVNQRMTVALSGTVFILKFRDQFAVSDAKSSALQWSNRELAQQLADRWPMELDLSDWD